MVEIDLPTFESVLSRDMRRWDQLCGTICSWGEEGGECKVEILMVSCWYLLSTNLSIQVLPVTFQVALELSKKWTLAKVSFQSALNSCEWLSTDMQSANQIDLAIKNKTTLENVKNENHMDGQQNGGLEGRQGRWKKQDFLGRGK